MRSSNIRLSLGTLGAAVVAASIVTVHSIAQQTPVTRANQRRATAAGQTASGQAGMTPIASAHATFERAARIMESALPIYDGHRHRAIQLARLAAREIRAAAMGTSSSSSAAGAASTSGAAGTTGSVSGTGAQRKTAAQQAAAIPKGTNVPLTNYNAAQIAASNTKMQQGLQLLQQGIQQVKAIGNDPGNHMSDALEFGNYSIEAANKGLVFVQSKM